MKITEIDVIPYRIPYHEMHHMATLTLSALENVVVHIKTDADVDGFGEAVSEPKWNSTVREAHEQVLREYLARPLIGMDPFDIAGVWQAMDEVASGHYSAKAAIDMALYDLIGHALELPACKYLGGCWRTEIAVEGPGFGIGLMDPDDAAKFALKAVHKGCNQVELKGGHPVGPQRDLDVIQAVYQACGSKVSLKVDVTEAYTFKTAMEVLPIMSDFGVDWVEQPLPRHQLEDLARLRERVSVGILVEESIGHPADVLRVANMGAADAIHLKLPMLGGITMARQIAAICNAAGLGIQPGSSTPSGLGLAAVHQFAATLPNVVRGCHGSPLARAVDDIIVSPIEAYAAKVKLGPSHGLGVVIDWDKLGQYRI